MTAPYDRLSQWLARERPELTPAAPNDPPDAPDEALPDALQAWWAWADPVARAAPPDEDGCLLRDWRLLDRATSAERRAEWSRNLAGRAEFDGWWRDAWVPIAERLDCDLLVVDLEGTFDAPGSVVEVVHDAPIRYVRAGGIDAWAEGLARSLEAGEWLREDDGLWWDDPDAHAWECLGATFVDGVVGRFPYPVELNLEHEPVEAPVGAWVDAWSSAVARTAPEARWEPLPHGWSALHLRAGGDLDETLSLLADAPPARLALELAHLSAALSAAGDARAGSVAARLLTLPAADLVAAVAHLDLALPTLRASLVTHAVAQSAARAEGASALCAALAANVGAHDEGAARHLRWWSVRLRPTADTRFPASVMQALAAARAGEPNAASQVDAILAEDWRLAELDVPLAAALVAACHAVGRWPEALVANWRFPHPAAQVGVRTLTALGAHDEARRIFDAVTDPHWRAALLLARAAALPAGDPAGQATIAEAEALVASFDELLWMVSGYRSDALRELRFDLASALLRRGAREAALASLDAWRRAGREAVALAAEKVRALLDDPTAQHGAPWRAPSLADFDALAATWRPSQLRQEGTVRLLRWAVALADGDATPRGRASLEAIEAVARADGLGSMRHADTLAVALVAYGRADDALAVAADPLWRSSARVFVALVARLAAAGRRDDARSLGRHLVRSRAFGEALAVAPAVAIVSPTSLPTLRATCDALAAETPSR
ncbi:MAG: hypothetical protein U0324_14560 [Polyangiales bacterium]